MIANTQSRENTVYVALPSKHLVLRVPTAAVGFRARLLKADGGLIHVARPLETRATMGATAAAALTSKAAPCMNAQTTSVLSPPLARRMERLAKVRLVVNGSV